MKYSLKIFVVTLALVIIGAGFVYYRARPHLSPADFSTLRIETLKTLLQLVAVGIAGGFLTWLLGERSKERDRLREQHEAATTFRREAMARLVTTTNVVRKAPLLIEAHRSKLTYGNELRSIVDAKLELGLLRHQIEDTKRFEGWQEIGSEIKGMEEYLEPLITEWREKYLDLPLDTGAAWPVIRELPELKDLRDAMEQSKFQSDYLSHYKKAIRLMSKDVIGGGEWEPIR
jgi:hypothetical protein